MENNIFCKTKYFRKKMPEICKSLFHVDNLNQQKGCIIILPPQHQFFTQNKTKIHKIFPGKPI